MYGIVNLPDLQFNFYRLKLLLSRIPLHLLFQILFNNGDVAGGEALPSSGEYTKLTQENMDESSSIESTVREMTITSSFSVPSYSEAPFFNINIPNQTKISLWVFQFCKLSINLNYIPGIHGNSIVSQYSIANASSCNRHLYLCLLIDKTPPSIHSTLTLN